jgi:hypothetical protein
MNTKRTIGAGAAAAMLALLGTTAAAADTGTPAAPPATTTTIPASPPPTTTTSTTPSASGDRADRIKAKLEERKQALAARKQALEERKQALEQVKQSLADERQKLVEEHKQAVDQRQHAAGGKPTAAREGKAVLFRFRGRLDSASTSSVTITVEGGNRAALHALLGAPVQQSFAIGADTEFLLWTDGVPKVVAAADLQKGDWVVVNVRAPRSAELDQLEAKPAGIVGDHGANPEKPDQPLFLFRGKLVSTASGSVTIDVATGNNRALRLLLGADREQTFAVDGETIFLRWDGKVPTVVAAADLTPGDRVTVRIRAEAGSDLDAVEATPARHVGEHEPAATAATGKS